MALAPAPEPVTQTSVVAENVSDPVVPPDPTLLDQQVPETPQKLATPKARQILFAGRHQGWLLQTKSDLFLIEPYWHTHHAEDQEQMLELLEVAPFDAVVLDGKMAEAPALAEVVTKASPKTSRLVRCDLGDRAALSRWGIAGLTLLGYYEGAGPLVESLRRAWWFQEQMESAALKKLVTSIRKLPVIPKLYGEVTEELRKPDVSMDAVGAIVAQDPVMSAKILQVANSALLGLATSISDPAQAIQYLGTERTRTLILAASVFSQFQGLKGAQFSIEKIWVHSLRVAFFARLIAMAETRDPDQGQMAFTAGLLHELGRLVVAANFPEMIDKIGKVQSASGRSLRDAEIEVTGAPHSQLGACLLATWGLPLSILEAIASHSRPEQSDGKGFALLTAVHAANAFTAELEQSNQEIADRVCVPYLERIGMKDRTNAWRTLCNVPTRDDEA